MNRTSSGTPAAHATGSAASFFNSSWRSSKVKARGSCPWSGPACSQPVCITYWIRREDRLQTQSGNPNVTVLPLSQESGNSIMQMMTGGCALRASRTANPPACAHRNTSSPSRSHQRTPRLGSRGGRQRIPINSHLDAPVADVLAQQIALLMRREAEHEGVDLPVRNLLEQITGLDKLLPIDPRPSTVPD